MQRRSDDGIKNIASFQQSKDGTKIQRCIVLSFAAHGNWLRVTGVIIPTYPATH
jgi:hypothetical protein